MLKYVIKYKDKDSIGRVELVIPKSDLSPLEYRERLEEFVRVLNQFNRYFKKKKIRTERFIERCQH